MKPNWIVLLTALPVGLVVSTLVNAAPEKAGTTSSVGAYGGKDKGSALQLEVKQLPLATVLKELSKKTSAPIHYSVLPEGLLTATCAGSTLKPVLECLLDHKADVIVRYSKDKKNRINKNVIAEAWVLGAKLESVPDSKACTTDSGASEMRFNRADADGFGELTERDKQSNALVNAAQSDNAQARAEAIGALLSLGKEHDANVQAMLEKAVHDPDANVRAQAVSTLTHRDDYSANAPQIIQEALQDESVDVRLMAVDAITDDIGLLQQAVNDSDETIRTTAALKLQELTKQQESK